MSKFFLEPSEDFVLVIDMPQETSIDGIELPSNMRQQEMVFGAVVFVGPDVKRTKVQDQVVYGPYAGKTVVVAGVEYRALREGQIELYVRQTD